MKSKDVVLAKFIPVEEKPVTLSGFAIVGDTSASIVSILSFFLVEPAVLSNL